MIVQMNVHWRRQMTRDISDICLYFATAAVKFERL
jgi:hypothetical protein